MPSERPQLGWRVDPETKKAFQRYVDSLPGSNHGRYGKHLERAMREYIEADRLAHLQEQLELIADNLGVEKVGKSNTAIADGRYAAPKGKNPGDVRRRTEVIIDALLDYAEDDILPSDDYGQYVTRKIVTDVIKQVGDVHSKKTIRKYLERVLKRSMFKEHPERAEAWVVHL